MNVKKVVLLAVTLLSIGLASCKKGDTGEPGKDGTNGNANVTSATLTAPSWIWSAPDYWRYNTWSGISILTSDVVNTGAVMLYQTNGGTHLQLPITVGIGSTVEIDRYQYSVGAVSVFIENANLSDPISQIPVPTTYKLVCIPQRVMLENPNVDYKNYEKVKLAFHLKD